MENLERQLAAKTIYITGATGLVGGWLTHAVLRAGARVVALIRDLDPQSEFARANLLSRVVAVAGEVQDFALQRRIFNEYAPDFVFHLGAQTLVGNALSDPLETFESNIRGTYCLLEAARIAKSAKAIIVASSDKAYGKLLAERYIEDDPLSGEHPYDVSKSCTDLLARAYHVTYGLPTIIARCGNIYGGGDVNWSRLIPGTIRSLLRNEHPMVRSDGTLVRDYLHVQDVVKAYVVLALNAGRSDVAGGAFNFSSGCEKNVIDVVDKLRELMGKKHLTPVIKNEATAEIQTQVLDWGKAKKLLGWSPSIGFEQGLKEAITWYTALEGSADRSHFAVS